MTSSLSATFAVALPVVLLVLQAALNVPQLVRLFRASNGGVPLTGEALSLLGGLGWLVWAWLAGDPAIGASALLALLGFGPTTWLLVRAGHPWRLAAGLGAAAASAAAVALLVGGTASLGTLLTGFAGMQYGAYLVAAVRCPDWSGYSSTSGVLRVVYGLGWALHGRWQGNALLVAWGLLTAATFATTFVLATNALRSDRRGASRGGPDAPAVAGRRSRGHGEQATAAGATGSP